MDTDEHSEIGPRALAVRASHADHLDGALLAAIAPALAEAGLEAWSFLRWVDWRGAHVRVRVDATPEQLDALALACLRRLPGALDRPAATSPLPRPASQRTPTGWAVEALEGDGAVPGGDADRAGSAAAVAALEGVQDGLDRLALALGVLRRLAGEGDPSELWSPVAESWAGDDDERGEQLLERLGRRAADLREELERREAAIAADGPAAAHVESLATRDGLGEEDGADAVRGRAHLVCNRLGVTPIEEAALALVLRTPPAPEEEVEEAEDTPPGDAAIRLRGVGRTSAGRTVLDGVDLTVRPGQLVGVLGPAGGARSALVGIAAGLATPTRGEVGVLGHDPKREREVIAARVAVPVPDRELSGRATVRENLVQFAAGGEARAVDAALVEADLEGVAGEVVRDAAPGVRRRTAIACALVGGAELLVLDEPSEGLSAIDREEVWSHLRRLREAGRTTLLASSSLEEVLHLCDRVATLQDDGTLTPAIPVDELPRDLMAVRRLHVQVAEDPDVALLRDLPEVERVEVEVRPDHWVVMLHTREPDGLRRLLVADPDFPALITSHVEDLEAAAEAPAAGAAP